MDMTPSKSDLEFRDRFEAGEAPPSDFHHREHLRLAFVYLCENNVEDANAKMRSTLMAFLQANNVSAGKYHETLTYSWVQAVRHFMERAKGATSFEQFLVADDRLLDAEIMLSHYNRETLFSDKARIAFVPPDLEAIPQYN